MQKIPDSSSLHHLSLRTCLLLGPFRPFLLPFLYPPSLPDPLLLLCPFLFHLFPPCSSPLQPSSSLQLLGFLRNPPSFCPLFSAPPPFRPHPLPLPSPSFFLPIQQKSPSHKLNFPQKSPPPSILPNPPRPRPLLPQSLRQNPSHRSLLQLLLPLFVCSNESIPQD